MKKKAPYIFGFLGLSLVGISFFLRGGTPDADETITNLASTFMIVAGSICLLIGVATFFMRNHGEDW
jgi:hypothetical protein